MRPFTPLIVVLLAAVGCGGGGGGGSVPATLVGRVIDVQTGGPPNPAANVGVPGAPSVATSLADGSFVVSTNAGASQLLVTSQIGYPSFTFTTSPASGITDVGDLWVGPSKVSVHGRALDSSTSLPITAASVTFGGGRTTSAADGTFNVPNVAYSATTQAAFWGILGNVQATNYFDQGFTAAPNLAVGGVVSVGDILVTPSNNSNPPPSPFDIVGRVLPVGTSSGTVVTLSLNGTPVRQFDVGADGVYTFWVAPNATAYVVTFSHPTTPTSQNASVSAQNVVVHVPDVTLN